MSKEAAEVLRKARELISDQKRWTQKAYARDRYGFGTGPWLKNAICFCSRGALMKASGLKVNEVVATPANTVLQSNMNGNVPLFNDTHTHAEVLEAFDRAIAAAEAS